MLSVWKSLINFKYTCNKASPRWIFCNEYSNTDHIDSITDADSFNGTQSGKI